MHNILNYLLCFSIISLIIISTKILKKNNDNRKLLAIVKAINVNNISLNELGDSFNLIFIDPATEQKFNNLSLKDEEYLVFYQAPQYRIKLFEKKVPKNMMICSDFDKKILNSLEIRSFPCLIEVNLNNFKLSKTYGG
ncbi:hypothetical protein [Paenibacillus sp. TSA_86.1]|uniref:hypothetical protein n=1 Tax=Paenibacillus sp. TSA_86.1 TaxID=3415649 RepID=UPI0040452CD2